MLRKWIIALLCIAFLLSALCSCTTVELPANVGALSETSRTISAGSFPAVQYLNTDGTVSAKENTYPPFSVESLSVIPIPEGKDGLLIRSIKQEAENQIQLYGNVDLTDPETVAALEQIHQLLATYDKDIAFCAYSLDGSRAIAYNCEQKFFSACTIKASYMLYCCRAIEQGLASPDDTMAYDKELYYHGGSGQIKNAEDGTVYTLRELIRLSLRYSDNIAYKMLVHYFGKDSYNEMVENLGVSRLRLSSSTSISTVWNNNTTTRDLCVIWRELYFYFASETEMSKLYKTACTNTPYNYATKYLKEDYTHKSGDRFAPDPVYNDAAIVWKDTPYVIATLNGSEGEEMDEYVVATIVKLINDHIMK